MMLPTFSPPPQTQQLPPFRYTNKLLTCLSPVENKNSCPHSLAPTLVELILLFLIVLASVPLHRPRHPKMSNNRQPSGLTPVKGAMDRYGNEKDST
jgi:hypothetical protein